MPRRPQTLKEQVQARKLEKRDRLQESLISGNSVPRPRGRYSVRALPFEADLAQFELCGGDVARYPLQPGTYTAPNGKIISCLHLAAPSNFTYATNLDGILRYIYELRRQIFIERRFLGVENARAPIYLNLDSIISVDLPGALILAAELDRIRRVLGFRPALDDHRWDPNIRSTLMEFGLHEIVHARGVEKIKDTRTKVKQDRFQVIKMQSGTSSSNELAKTIRDELFEACSPFSGARPQIYNVLVEAFNNTREHAYPNFSGEDGLPSVRRWWAGALVDHEIGAFTLAVYDQGIGIPERFARQHELSNMERQQPSGAGDLLVLQRAAEHGSSSTTHPGRGNGLWQMTELTRAIPGSEVAFTSLKGSVAYRHGVVSRAFVPPQRFCGTMVRWYVPFRPAPGAAR